MQKVSRTLQLAPQQGEGPRGGDLLLAVTAEDCYGPAPTCGQDSSKEDLRSQDWSLVSLDGGKAESYGVAGACLF